MNTLELLQAATGTLYLITITGIGIRVIMLAARNRTTPELLLGISLLAGGTLGATLEAVGMTVDGGLDIQVAGTFLAVGKALGIGGFLCQILFIRVVFRPNESWALIVIASIMLVLVGSYAAFAAAGTFSNAQMPVTIFWFEFVGRCAGSVWLLIESLRYYELMKRRLALGLADPIVTDRFRLWAVAGLAGLVFLATSVPPVVAPDKGALWLTWLIPVFAAAGMLTSICYLLAFFPPAFYRRHVTRRLQVGSAQGE